MLRTLAEAAAILGCSPSTLRHQALAGRLKARLRGGIYFVSDREIARYRAESLGRPGRPSHRAARPSCL